MIYAEFESILVPKDNGKQNQKESYTNKYHKQIACSYGQILVCFDDKLVSLLRYTQTKMQFEVLLII